MIVSNYGRSLGNLGRRGWYSAYLVSGTVEAVPTAALALYIGLGLAQLAGQAADRLRGMRLPYFELNVWNNNLMIILYKRCFKFALISVPISANLFIMKGS